jgi:hypothetical protein
VAVLPASEPVEECDDSDHERDAPQYAKGIFHHRSPVNENAHTANTNQVATPDTMIFNDTGCWPTN